MIERPAQRRLSLACFLVLGAAVAAVLGPARAEPGQGAGRVVVLGFDGADARTTQAMIDAGELPNLKKLAEQGTFAPLVSTNPAESAAGWAALNTGLDPVGNNVPSFIYRKIDGDMIFPDQGHITIEDVSIDDLEPEGLLGIVATYRGPKLMALAGATVFLLFFVLFTLLLRVKAPLAAFLGLILGGVGAWGASVAGTYVPDEVPDVYKNSVVGDGFWAHAARGGADAIVLDAALAFDQPDVDGARVLGGLGLPDIRAASNGAWSVYTTDDLILGRPPEGEGTSSNSGTVFRVTEREGKISTSVYGPVDFWKKEQIAREAAALQEQLDDPSLGWKKSGELRDQKRVLDDQLDEFAYESYKHQTELPFEIERRGERLALTIDGQTQELGEGEWSDWYRLKFEINPLIDAHAVTRVKVVSVRDPLEVYVGTFDIDPQNPPFWQPISQPRGFSSQLADWIGEPYETLGWSCMTNQMKDKKIDPETFLEDIEFTLGWREKLTHAALDRSDWRLLFSVFSTTDRMQHIMYKHYDTEHPYHDVEEAAREVEFFGETIPLSETIPAIYRQMDRVVGEVMAKLRPDDVLILCADHGFTSYRRGMEVNNWLAENGYLVLRDGISKSEGSSQNLYIDWDRTKAYSLGLGMVFLNLKGREPNGIVEPDEARGVLERIASDFVRAKDLGPTNDPFSEPQTVGHDAKIMMDLYPGDWGTTKYRCADLMLGFAENYRASWGSVLGKIRLTTDDDGDVVLGPTYRNNSNNWSGDHASNSPDVVTGIFFSSQPIAVPAAGVSVMDVAPTVLDRLGVAIPEGLRDPLPRKPE